MENLSVNTIELLLIIFAEINQGRKYIFCPVLPPSHDHVFLHFLSHFGKKKIEKYFPGRDSNPRPSNQKVSRVTIRPWILPIL